MTADTTPSIVATTAPERLTKLRNWLRGLRALSIRQDGAGQVFAGILEAFEERGCAPETVATDIDALLARAEAAEANARRLAEALRPFAEAFHTLSSRWEAHETHWQDALHRPLTVGQLASAADALKLTTKEADRG